MKRESWLPGFGLSASQGVAICGFGKTEWTCAKLAPFQHFGMTQGDDVPGRALYLNRHLANKILTKIDDRFSGRRLSDGNRRYRFDPANRRAKRRFQCIHIPFNSSDTTPT